jgi:CxxC-x17-CxxC domain-containing protein
MQQFQDQTLTCADCGQQFTWTASEQEFYQKKGFTNPPKRCPDCRAKKKAQFGDNRGGGFHNAGPRQSYPITCSNCGKQDTVPFQPKGDRPVLCRDCFQQKRA